MRWRKPNLRSSLYALLGHFEPTSIDVPGHRLDAIRQAMLDLLGERAATEFPTFMRRVLTASDAQGLWYARSDLFGALAALHGESRARDLLDPVTLMFEGLVPQALMGGGRKH